MLDDDASSSTVTLMGEKQTNEEQELSPACMRSGVSGVCALWHFRLAGSCSYGPGLPEGFDPADSKGLGMKIIASLVKQIGGKLQVAPGEDGRGARFTVIFGSPLATGSCCPGA
jgi:hypothetical protein